MKGDYGKNRVLKNIPVQKGSSHIAIPQKKGLGFLTKYTIAINKPHIMKFIFNCRDVIKDQPSKHPRIKR
jgi:hypothetical protein